MGSGPIISWQIDGARVETVTDFIFLGSKIIVDGDCSHEIKRCLLFGRKTMTNLDSVLKHITLPTKVRIVKAMVFPVVMYRCKCWTIKKAESQEWMLSNCDAGEDSWESPGQQGDQTSQSWRKSTLNIHRKDSSWIWSYNTFGRVMQRADLLEKTLMLERLKAKVEESGRRWDG